MLFELFYSVKTFSRFSIITFACSQFCYRRKDSDFQYYVSVLGELIGLTRRNFHTEGTCKIGDGSRMWLQSWSVDAGRFMKY